MEIFTVNIGYLSRIEAKKISIFTMALRRQLDKDSIVYSILAMANFIRNVIKGFYIARQLKLCMFSLDFNSLFTHTHTHTSQKYETRIIEFKSSEIILFSEP